VVLLVVWFDGEFVLWFIPPKGLSAEVINDCSAHLISPFKFKIVFNWRRKTHFNFRYFISQ